MWAHIDERIALEFLEKVDLNSKTVLLHSNSRTVTTLLQVAKTQGIGCKIIQTESRPALEGRIQAGKISVMGFPVTLIADAAVALYIPKTDMAILGADSIGTSHFVNKIGSHSIALACKEKLKPVYVLADERKNSDHRIREEIKSEQELWSNAMKGIKVENYYFESVPSCLISEFFMGKQQSDLT